MMPRHCAATTIRHCQFSEVFVSLAAAAITAGAAILHDDLFLNPRSTPLLATISRRCSGSALSGFTLPGSVGSVCNRGPLAPPCSALVACRQTGKFAGRLQAYNNLTRQLLADKTLYLVEVAELVKRNKRDCRPACTCTACSADTVDIILGKARKIEVDDMADPVDIQTSCRHVRCDKQLYP